MLWLRWGMWRTWVWLGWVGTLGVVVALLGSYMLELAEQQRQEAKDILIALKTKPARTDEVRPIQSPIDDLPMFYASLPKREGLPILLDRLFVLAARHSLQLSAGEYLLQLDPQAGVQRYRLQLPVVGSYDAISGFVAEALHAIPTLTVESIHLKRNSIDADQLEAELQLQLLLQIEAPR
ncbi:hypothetical protein [Chitinolyticbacter albus]|uniref:hypothetical protein n=1 Tax=Chitinolyticbacter albus TaxID=2961951 RepID=UPI00210E83DC|nr:hypothetical protein [Chitinolyticbacter albus]